MVRTLVKKILSGEFDDEGEMVELNEMLYKLLPTQDKPLFKSRFMKSSYANSRITSVP